MFRTVGGGGLGGGTSSRSRSASGHGMGDTEGLSVTDPSISSQAETKSLTTEGPLSLRDRPSALIISDHFLPDPPTPAGAVEPLQPVEEPFSILSPYSIVGALSKFLSLSPMSFGLAVRQRTETDDAMPPQPEGWEQLRGLAGPELTLAAAQEVFASTAFSRTQAQRTAYMRCITRRLFPLRSLSDGGEGLPPGEARSENGMPCLIFAMPGSGVLSSPTHFQGAQQRVYVLRWREGREERPTAWAGEGEGEGEREGQGRQSGVQGDVSEAAVREAFAIANDDSAIQALRRDVRVLTEASRSLLRRHVAAVVLQCWHASTVHARHARLHRRQVLTFAAACHVTTEPLSPIENPEQGGGSADNARSPGGGLLWRPDPLLWVRQMAAQMQGATHDEALLIQGLSHGIRSSCVPTPSPTAIMAEWWLSEVSRLVYPDLHVRFTEYSPRLFRALRSRVWGIEEDDFRAALGSREGLRTLSQNAGRSGSFFLISNDRRYLVKSMTRSEHTLLCKLLRDYSNYVTREPNTLITRYLGVYQVKVLPRSSLSVHANQGRSVFFVVINHLFQHHTPDQVYDLKGSQVNRRVLREGEAPQPHIVMKDQDWGGRKVRLSPPLGRELSAQVQRDATWLEAHGVMDYSLLLGLKYCPPGSGRREGEGGKAVAKARHQGVSIFSQHEGGLCGAADEHGGRWVYVMGIIDTLQTYTLHKQVERTLKVAAGHSGRGLSAVSPRTYARRFVAYIHSIVHEDEPKDTKDGGARESTGKAPV